MVQRRVWITVAFILVLFLTNMYYVGFVMEHQGDDEYIVSLDSIPHDTEPTDMDREVNGIQFGFNAAEPILGDDYQSFIDDVIARLGGKDTLQIVGLQYGNEDRYNLAEERAQQVALLFANTLEFNQIQQTTKTMLTELKPDDLCSGFNYVIKVFDEQTPENIEESAGLVQVVYFEENEKSLPVAQYETIRKALNLPQENFNQELVLIGYADEFEDNPMTLAKKRAWRVKSVIWDLGVDPLLITIKSRVGRGSQAQENSKVEIYLK